MPRRRCWCRPTPSRRPSSSADSTPTASCATTTAALPAAPRPAPGRPAPPLTRRVPRARRTAQGPPLRAGRVARVDGEPTTGGCSSSARSTPTTGRLLAARLAHPSVDLVGDGSRRSMRLARADVLLLPSLEEGSALVTYEAQVAGCVPLVSTAAGALLDDDVHGLLHEPSDVATLTAPARPARPRPRHAWSACAPRQWPTPPSSAGRPPRRACSPPTAAPRPLVTEGSTRADADVTSPSSSARATVPTMLAAALESITRAVPRDVEVLVVDSASDDLGHARRRRRGGRRRTCAATSRASRSPGTSALRGTERPIVLFTDDDCHRRRRVDRPDPRAIRRPRPSAP